MTEDLGDGYLSGLTGDQRDELTRVSAPGLAALHEYLDSGEAVAFLGAGASAPLYPLWGGLIGELVDTAAARLTPKEAATCRAIARDSPEAVVEIIRRGLGSGVFREVLRRVLRVRTETESGRSWTPVQELVCRCPFKAVVTTNYDPGIVNARMRVRPAATATGFMTWEDELGLDRWRTGAVFGDDELPVLFAHGQHNRPDSIVLATTEYRRAYAGKLPQVLARLMDGHLVWIGFSFADQRVAAILREIADQTGTRIDPGAAPRHVALIAWDPAGADNDPEILAQRAEIEYGAQVVLYPAPGNDHSALARLLETLTDARFPAAADLPAHAGSPAAAPHPTAGSGERDTAVSGGAAGESDIAGRPADDRPGESDSLHERGAPDGGTAPGGAGTDGGGVPVAWVPPPEPVAHFTGRAEELARLDRWAADPQVSLIGVIAWGGAGKTALVTHWLQETGGASRRPGIRGVFGWSFYADPSAEHWAVALLDWARQSLGAVVTATVRPAVAVLALLRALPLVLVLDGLEVVQEGPAGGEFGRLLDGTLREVLAGACQLSHRGLVVLTSRFQFADLETFDGGAARMMEVPPFTPAEGAALLAASGGDWLPESERRDLVSAVDGHALATGVLAGLLAGHLPAADLATLRAELNSSTFTDARVNKVLEFYAGLLAEPDRYLLAAVCLFSRPVAAGAVLTVAGHEAFGGRLAGWTPGMAEGAVRYRLGGLATWHADGTISAHPLVRDTFRPLGLEAAETAADVALAGLPEGEVTSRADALRVVEAIELLLDAGHWKPASDLYRSRGDNGEVWNSLPAARLGQRAAFAFVATPARRATCAARLTPRDLSFYLNETGLNAMQAGDLATAGEYLPAAIRHDRDAGDKLSLCTDLRNLAECLGYMGETAQAWHTATEALTWARSIDEARHIHNSQTRMAWVAGLDGNSAEAESYFMAADEISMTELRGTHMVSIDGDWWADWLARTGRADPARAVAENNLQFSRTYGWNNTTARCQRLLGRLALSSGEESAAGELLTAAAECFQEGEVLVEYAATLVDLAEYARVTGNPNAEQYANEAITIAAPRGMVPVYSAALSARARIRADQVAATADADLLFRGRDAADAALHLAARRHMPWHELDALRAHAMLDDAERTGHGWAAKAEALHARLVPPGLDPDPLATVEKRVEAQKAAESGNEGGDD